MGEIDVRVSEQHSKSPMLCRICTVYIGGIEQSTLHIELEDRIWFADQDICIGDLLTYSRLSFTHKLNSHYSRTTICKVQSLHSIAISRSITRMTLSTLKLIRNACDRLSEMNLIQLTMRSKSVRLAETIVG